MKLSLKPLWTFIVGIVLTLYSACRKTDQTPEQQALTPKQCEIESKFFNTNRTTDPTEKALVDFLKRKNEKENFVEKTVKQIGYPIWEKTMAVKTLDNNASIIQNNYPDSINIYYIPFVRDTQNYVNASFVVTVTPTDTLLTNLIDHQYTQLPNDPSLTIDNAEKHTLFFMLLDYIVFGYKDFQITDSLLFNNGQENADLVHIELQQNNNLNQNTLLAMAAGPVCINASLSLTGCISCPGNVSYSQCWEEYYGLGASNSGTTLSGTGGGGGSGGFTPVPTITYLTNTLGLSSSQVTFLTQNPSYQGPLFNYISQNYSSQSVQICNDHINLLISEPEYVQFVNNHNNTGNHSVVWWMDDTWIDNPQYFNLDPYDDYRKLSAAEKALVKQYPTAAFIINQFNRPMAKNFTVQKFGSNGLNDKSDAFRHAFFQAVNTVRIGASLTQQFANAHEAEVPSQLIKEKEMDLFNNGIGIAYGQTQSYPASTPAMIANAIYTKVLNGELRYIKPLDFSASPYFDANHDGIQDCPTCLNGILSSSVLTPTNQ
jgi:hypothetical protein